MERELAFLVDAARRTGIEIDPAGSIDWLRAVRLAGETPAEFEIEGESGFGGHELAVIDFDPAELDRLRQIGRIVATAEQPAIQTALAIAGSAAQSRIHRYPSDFDFFERVHIDAPSIDEARGILGSVIRDNALSVAALPGFLLDEVYFGSHGGQPARWSPGEVLDETFNELKHNADTGLRWSDAAREPGFIKLDWLLLDRSLGGPTKVSKVVDATWTGSDGSIVSLDESVDADFQQIYLDARGAELAAFLTRDLPSDIRDDYVARLERAIACYCMAARPHYVKVAKRLYNICRLSGRYTEAIYLRELFDQPAARVWQALERLRLALQRMSEGARSSTVLDEIASDLDVLFETESSLPLDRATLVKMVAAPLGHAQLEPLFEITERVEERVNATFRGQLRNFPATRVLLDEILDKHHTAGFADE